MKDRIAIFNKYRCLLRELVGRDFKLKYRRSVLGYAWSLLNPLLMMLVLTAVFSQLFKYNIEKFAVYLIMGQTVFNFYSEATTTAMTSVYANADLIKKVYVPKYMFPLSKVCFAFVNMLCSLGAVIIVMAIQKVPPHITLVLLPVLFIYMFLIALGIGMLLSVVAVYFRDLTHLYGVFITAQMYLTPLFYPVEVLPLWVYRIVFLNPTYHLVEFFRNIALYGEWPTITEHLICLGFGVVFMALGLLVFKQKQKNFILYI